MTVIAIIPGNDTRSTAQKSLDKGETVARSITSLLYGLFTIVDKQETIDKASFLEGLEAELRRKSKAIGNNNAITIAQKLAATRLQNGRQDLGNLIIDNVKTFLENLTNFVQAPTEANAAVSST